MDMISKFFVHVVPCLLSHLPFAMTLGIVVLTTPSATLSLNQPINSDAIVFLYKNLLDTSRSPVHHWPALVTSTKRAFICTTHTFFPVCKLVFDLVKKNLAPGTGLAQPQNVKTFVFCSCIAVVFGLIFVCIMPERSFLVRHMKASIDIRVACRCGGAMKITQCAFVVALKGLGAGARLSSNAVPPWRI